MKSLISGVAAALAVLVMLAVGSAGANASSLRHQTWSNTWPYDTAVAFDTSAVDVCPMFPGPLTPTYYPSYQFSDVNLTDYVKITFHPAGGGNFRVKGVATVEGVINAANGSYTVTSGTLKEDRTTDLFTIFLGSGPVTITGPGGTVSGRAEFLDSSTDYPAAMSFLFTSIKSCNLS